MSNPEIGERLSISPRTAETHRTNLLRKLGLASQTELVRFAVGRGLIPG
jgi:DNA-binding CsgD family transcriptional regulator